jgi:AcrR family transcriptional regulator
MLFFEEKHRKKVKKRGLSKEKDIVFIYPFLYVYFERSSQMVEKMNESFSKEKEEQIILAARKIFSRYGYSKTTMEDISGAVEMGKASLYYYFPTKENLFHAAVLHEQQEFINKAASILKKQNSAEKKLKIYVEERLDFFQELVNLGALSFNTVHDKHSVSLKMYESFAEKEIEIINNIIQEGVNNGEFDYSIPPQYPGLLIHLLQGLRLKTIKTLNVTGMDPKIYRELRKEMLMTIELFIKGIKKNKVAKGVN